MNREVGAARLALSLRADRRRTFEGRRRFIGGGSSALIGGPLITPDSGVFQAAAPAAQPMSGWASSRQP
jgi:hypothetical protein